MPYAQEDLKSILAYIKSENPTAAAQMQKKFDTAFQLLRVTPNMGALAQDPRILQGFRMLVIDSYLVFYLVIGEEKLVEIHRVVHSRKNYLKDL